jgi:hypothetical protein
MQKSSRWRFIHFETPEITKMLHNVYKGSCIGKYPFRKPSP